LESLKPELNGLFQVDFDLSWNIRGGKCLIEKRGLGRRIISFTVVATGMQSQYFISTAKVTRLSRKENLYPLAGLAAGKR
jgi:hypothetical protein